VLQRLSAEAAATVCQLLLWAPSAWLRPDEPDLPSSNEVSITLLYYVNKVLLGLLVLTVEMHDLLSTKLNEPR
jgi:hypothetical protein